MFHASDLDWSNQGLEPILSLGNYEVSIWEGFTKRAWFFINYRTSHLPYAATLGEIDVLLDYNVINKNFVLTTPNLGNVINGSYFRIWELKEFVELQTDDLELYLNVSSQNSHPHLQWNEYHDPNILGYNIYRKITMHGGNCTNVIFTTSTSYLDEDFYIPPPKEPGNDLVEYWIKAKISSTEESLEGNHVQIGGTSIIQLKNSTKISNNDLQCTLGQNYPNPFNPVTTIEFTLKENSIVSLKVFDILGREVMTIINEMLEEGIHQVEFNGSDLKSGIYFYEMQAGNFSDVKKFILLK
jgi:hypothetical protein